jgi:hypothetical protein
MTRFAKATIFVPQHEKGFCGFDGLWLQVVAQPFKYQHFCLFALLHYSLPNTTFCYLTCAL